MLECNILFGMFVTWSMILVPLFVGKLMCWTRLMFSKSSWYRFCCRDGLFTLMFVSPANIVVPVIVDTFTDGMVSILSRYSIFRWGTHLHMSLFLSSARLSVAHHISGTVHYLIIIWYTCVKWWYLKALCFFFFILLKFWSFGLLGG